MNTDKVQACGGRATTPAERRTASRQLGRLSDTPTSSDRATLRRNTRHVTGGLSEARLDPMIQAEAVVQKNAKRQETSRDGVVPTNSPEVRIINQEEKNEQQAEEGSISERTNIGEVGRLSAEATRNCRPRSAQRQFSRPFSWAHGAYPGRRLLEPMRIRSGFRFIASQPPTNYTPRGHAVTTSSPGGTTGRRLRPLLL